MNYQIELSTQSGTTSHRLRIPVLPSEMPTKRETETGTYNIIAGGEAILPRNPKPRTVKITSFFPADFSAAYVTDKTTPMTPYEFVKLVEGWQDKRTPVTFTQAKSVNRTAQTPTNAGRNYTVLENSYSFPAIVTEFEYGVQNGGDGAVYYTLGITEYRRPIAVRLPQTYITRDISFMSPLTTAPSGDWKPVVGARARVNIGTPVRNSLIIGKSVRCPKTSYGQIVEIASIENAKIAKIWWDGSKTSAGVNAFKSFFEKLTPIGGLVSDFDWTKYRWVFVDDLSNPEEG